MKRFLCAFIAVMTLISVIFAGGCGEGNDSNPTQETTVSPTEPTTTETTPDKKEENELKMYVDGLVEGDSPLYGTWKLNDLDYMYIIFRNDDLAELAMDNQGFLSRYLFDEKEGTLTVQLLPGTIDGVYDYEFSNDKKELTLTLDDKTLELSRDDSYSLIPKAPKEPVFDPNILGWWENKDGEVYYFGEDGLMYNSVIAYETFYTYTIENNRITAVYKYGDKNEEKLSYKVKGDSLTVNGEKYTKK